MKKTESSNKKKKLLKRISGILLTAVLALGTVSLPPFSSEVRADEPVAVKTITGLGTGAIGNPSYGAGGWSYVYYGKFNSNPVKYRVLSKDTTDYSKNGTHTLFLDCDSILTNMAFHGSSNVWSSSSIRSWLNGNDFLDNANVFSVQEKAAIITSQADQHELTQGEGDKDVSEWTKNTFQNYVALDDHIFALDAEEVSTNSYGYPTTDEANRNRIKKDGSGAGSWWWLRSPDSINGDIAGSVSDDGGVFSDYVSVDGGVSPAFNVNLSSVIFSSLISGTAGQAGAEYKLTLKDSALGVTTGTITRKGKTVTVPYSNVSGSSTQLSVVMTDGSWDTDKGCWSSGASLEYYGKLNIDGSIGTSGTGTFELPEGFSLSNGWKAYIVAEKVNGEKETDYASIPVAFTIPKLDPVCIAPKGLTATYGQKLADVALTNPEGNTPGTWAWVNSTQSVSNVVSPANTFKANFTPTDTANYNTVENVDVAVTVGKADSAVTKAPEAKTLTYTGSAQALVTAGTAEGGTMQYALGTDATIPPADNLYTTSIPTGKNAGTYYVWYKVVGDKNHFDSDVNGPVKVEITSASEPDPETDPTPAPSKISIEGAKIVLSPKSLTYNGKKRSVSVKSVTVDDKKLEAGKDYTVKWSPKTLKNAGTYTVTITGKGDYTGSAKAELKIAKAKNTLKVKAVKKTYNVSAKKLSDKAQTIKGSKIFKFTDKKKTKGTITYKISSVKKKGKTAKGFSINSKDGKLKLKKGLKSGSYTVKVIVRAEGDKNYKEYTRTVEFTVRVK